MFNLGTPWPFKLTHEIINITLSSPLLETCWESPSGCFPPCHPCPHNPAKATCNATPHALLLPSTLQAPGSPATPGQERTRTFSSQNVSCFPFRFALSGTLCSVALNPAQDTSSHTCPARAEQPSGPELLSPLFLLRAAVHSSALHSELPSDTSFEEKPCLGYLCYL